MKLGGPFKRSFGRGGCLELIRIRTITLLLLEMRGALLVVVLLETPM